MKIRQLDLAPGEQHASHNALGIPPLEVKVTHPARLAWHAGSAALLLLAGGALYWLGWQHPAESRALIDLLSEWLRSPAFWTAVAVGFSAQAVDGALGMAYGITSTTFLLGAGVSPAAASGAVHIAEVFTSGLSGASHIKFGNVDRRLFLRLVIPGVVGGVAGAYVLTSIDGQMIKPYIAAYLLLMGLYILYRAFHARPARQGPLRHVGKLALTGGFVDAVGGGGWGPVVTSTLVGRGSHPRRTIGSVNTAEFFIALATAGSFALFAELGHWELVAGLVFGGMFAAPFAAWLCSRLQARTLMWLIGVLITALSLFNLYRALS